MPFPLNQPATETELRTTSIDAAIRLATIRRFPLSFDDPGIEARYCYEHNRRFLLESAQATALYLAGFCFAIIAYSYSPLYGSLVGDLYYFGSDEFIGRVRTILAIIGVSSLSIKIFPVPDWFIRHGQLIIAIVAFVFAPLLLYAWSGAPVELISSYAYGIMIIHVMDTHAILGLRNIWATVCSAVMIVCYSFAAAYYWQLPSEHLTQHITMLSMTSVMGFFASHQLELANRKSYLATLQSDALLLNVLPASIAERLMQAEPDELVADKFAGITVLFADLKGFTALSATMSAEELMRMLNQIFSRFDELANELGLEKIKTIGDAYMVAGGMPDESTGHASDVAKLAIRMVAAFAELKQELDLDIDIRIGMNSGPAVAGVVGTRKFSYDVWGDTVNTASRMESHGEPGRVQVSQATYEILKDEFVFEERGLIDIKGKGQMKTWWLTGERV